LSEPVPPPFIPLPALDPGSVTPSQERALRNAIIKEALSWVGTPYAQQAAVKGAAVDCVMLMVSAMVAGGILLPFDPRPYPPLFHLHRDDERYLGWLTAIGNEVASPQPGDFVLWKFGRVYSHGGVIIAPGVVCNASSLHRRCTTNDMGEAWLATMRQRGVTVARPRKFFDAFVSLRVPHG
jgi:cell wall-associated NlpC family hydrolase